MVGAGTPVIEAFKLGQHIFGELLDINLRPPQE